MRLELQRDKIQSSHDNYSFPDTASSNSWMNSYNSSIGDTDSIGGTGEHEFTEPTV